MTPLSLVVTSSVHLVAEEKMQEFYSKQNLAINQSRKLYLLMYEAYHKRSHVWLQKISLPPPYPPPRNSNFAPYFSLITFAFANPFPLGISTDPCGQSV